MSGTVREIVSFADKDSSSDDARINEALKIACADSFITELDNGIDTVLGERGTGLSEGQMQRIAIARAIFSKAPILVLDEATSALDESTEKQLLENLRALTDKTVIIVTHRAAALDICDRKVEF
jgi:ATP-binding cassette subfamily B protein